MDEKQNTSSENENEEDRKEALHVTWLMSVYEWTIVQYP